MIRNEIIKGYERYTISETGEVTNTKTGRVMKTCLVSKGYHQVALTTNSNRKGLYIHRLLALAYIPNPEGKPFINHINGIKTDNNLSNLEWTTPGENIRHAYKTGLVPKIIKVMQGAKLSESQVLDIRKFHSNGMRMNKIAEKFKISAQNIGYIVKRKTWNHI